MTTTSRSAAEISLTLTGDGQAARLIRAADWSRTAMGAPHTWPPALRTLLGVMLHSRHPMFLWWGPELVQFYNDAYLPSFGVGKHPAAMGQRGADCWREIWPIISPQIDDVMLRGIASCHEDQLVPIFRNDRIEDVYWSYAYSPVLLDEGGIGGCLVICSETTQRVIGERRQRIARRFAQALSGALSSPDVSRAAIGALAQATLDVPAVLFYRRERDGQRPSLQRGTVGDTAQLDRADQAIHAHVARSPQLAAQLIAGLPTLLRGAIDLPAPDAAERLVDVFLVPARGADGRTGIDFVAYGLNPRIPFDEGYGEFLQQLTSSIALAKARADAAGIQDSVQTERNNLLMQAPVATAVLVGPDLVFELANTRYCELVGRTGLVGKTYAQAFPELVGTALPEILQAVYRTGRAHTSPETLLRLDRNKKGKPEDCYFEFNLEPMRGISGEVYGLMAVAVDVTAQVQARLALERSHAERQQLLQQAESASRAKDEFLAMLGHELRNPLSPIVTALHIMRQRNDSSTRREQATIQRQVDHLVRLVDDLLDVATIARGKVQLRHAATQLSEVLKQAVEMASFLLEQRQHVLRIELPEEPLPWWGDAARLAQVVANLLTNAARYTPPQGSILLAADQQGQELVIRVQDNGIGIAPDLLPHVFEMFYQGRRGVDRAEGGLGLGLALVKNLVAMHGGSAEAFSEGDGKGSEFVVRLPVRAGDSPGEPAAAAAPPGDPNGKRVLVVDDNQDAAESLAEVLRLQGHEVQVAFQPLEALVVAEQFRPEIALLDIGLPGMDGYELASRFRERFDASSCKLVALTGYGQANDKARSASAGFAVHLVKPVDFETLDRLLRE